MKGMKSDPFIHIGLAVAVFLVTLLALFEPAAAMLLVLVVGGLIVAVTHRASGRRAARKVRPCLVCGRRFRGADMVEHHVHEHRECAS